MLSPTWEDAAKWTTPSICSSSKIRSMAALSRMSA